MKNSNTSGIIYNGPGNHTVSSNPGTCIVFQKGDGVLTLSNPMGIGPSASGNNSGSWGNGSNCLKFIGSGLTLQNMFYSVEQGNGGNQYLVIGFKDPKTGSQIPNTKVVIQGIDQNIIKKYSSASAKSTALSKSEIGNILFDGQAEGESNSHVVITKNHQFVKTNPNFNGSINIG